MYAVRAYFSEQEANFMRVCLDIDPALLAEAMRLCGARTRKEVIRTALAELVRRHRIAELAAMAGALDLGLDPEGLDRLRADG
jgi:Arc/MetJ family transcription regulator